MNVLTNTSTLQTLSSMNVLDNTSSQTLSSMNVLDNTSSQMLSSNSRSTTAAAWPASRTVGENAVISLLIILIALVAVVGNVMVVAAVFLYNRLKEEVSNLFIVSLSLTDLSSASIVMISSLTAVAADRWSLGRAWCSIVCGANYWFIIVSMLTLCFISLDRYVAINHSLRYHVFVTKRRVLVLIAFTWLQGFCFGLVPVLSEWVDYDYGEVICAIQWHLHGNPVLIYVIATFTLNFFLPGLVLTIAYCKIFKTARKIKPHKRPMVQMVSLQYECHQIANAQQASGAWVSPTEPCVSAAFNRELSTKTKYGDTSKAVRSLLIVVLAYFICMTPFSVTKLYKVCIPSLNSLPAYANTLATFFQYLSSAVNPFIYGMFRRDFQKAFLYLLWRVVHRRSRNSTSFPNTTAIL